jgi:general secretion pathway protein L
MRAAVAQAGGLGLRFLGWWLGELGTLVPGPLRRAFSGRTGALCFRVIGDELVASRVVDGEVEELLRLDVSESAVDVRPAVARLLRTHARRSDDIVLELEPEQVLRKTLDLPLAAEEGLAELLWFELDRQTPYRPEQARYDYRIAARDMVRRRIKVELLVAPLKLAEQLEARAAQWGIEPTVLTVAGLDDPAAPSFNLSAKRAMPSRGGRIGVALLALLAAGLLGAAVWIPLEAQRKAARDAEAAVEEARKAAFVAADLRDELERRAKAGSFLIRRKSEAPMVTAVLADLTRLLPDDTWLFELHIRDREVRARGYAPAASSILELIERGPVFEKARFTSPVTRVPGIDAERFDLTFELAGGGKES